MSHPTVAEMANDTRLLEIARQFVGETAIPFRATLFDKNPEANWLVAWHQDTALPLKQRVESQEWTGWSVKLGVHYAHAPTWALEQVVALRIHLDESHAQNGPLQVIPGSHELGVLSDQEVSEVAHQSKPVECLVPKGGVLAMRPLVIHASPKATSTDPRRVLHVEYASSLTLGAGAELALC